MNGPLQRLVARACGTPEPALRRIEPLLTPRYASAAGGETVAPEQHQQRIASHTLTMAPATTTSPTVPVARLGAADADADPLRPSSATSDAPTALAPQPTPASTQTPSVRDDVEPASPAVATTTELRVERLVESRIETETQRIVPAPSRTEVRRDQPIRPVIARAPVERSVERRETVMHDATPVVTISIGRIDVHAPPAPSAPAVAAPRRPAFRPSVTLDAFLRGGGERR
jgi:hypothetical protein